MATLKHRYALNSAVALSLNTLQMFPCLQQCTNYKNQTSFT